MMTKTLFVDSRTKVKVDHANFVIALPEQMTLRDARVRIDNVRTIDTFTTVSSWNKYLYFLDGSGGLTHVSLSEGAHTGSTYAAEMASKSGRSCIYVHASKSLQLGYAAATRVI